MAFILANFQFLWPFTVISARCTDGGKVWDSSTQNVTSSVHLFAKAGANLKVPCERFIIQYHCVNGDWLCQWKMAIFDPHRIHTPWPITKNLVQVIMSAVHTAVPNLVQIRPRGASGQMGENNEFLFIYLFIPFSWTHLQVWPDDGFSRLMAQTTRTRARRVCLLGVSLLYCSPFWG